ncbi:MAG: TolB family protein [Niastella sp.]|uniref:TolB family protein n=1 Tax=Niastella sp. TaxID=1869183 RepID=UPI0038999EE4
MKKNLYWIALVLLFAACSKAGGGDDGTTDPVTGTGTGTGATQLGKGILYYDWATEGAKKFDLQTGVKATFLPYNTRRNGWDVSRDNTLLIESTDDPDDYDNEVYTITNVKDNTIVSKFKKLSGYSNLTSPQLSYDKKLILVPPTYDDGVIILDLQGKILFNLASYQGQKLEGRVIWMPDNTFLFSQGNNLYRTNTAFTAATLVKTFNFDTWGYYSASPDGSKIALRGGNHLWMMNADGSNLTQITESNDIEVWPVFSPDSKYLLIGYNYTLTNQMGRWWNQAIIPADFGKYNLDDKADKRVIPLIAKGENRPEAADGITLWR